MTLTNEDKSQLERFVADELEQQIQKFVKSVEEELQTDPTFQVLKYVIKFESVKLKVNLVDLQVTFE